MARWRIVIDTPEIDTLEFRRLIEALVTVLRQFSALTVRVERRQLDR